MKRILVLTVLLFWFSMVMAASGDNPPLKRITIFKQVQFDPVDKPSELIWEKVFFEFSIREDDTLWVQPFRNSGSEPIRIFLGPFAPQQFFMFQNELYIAVTKTGDTSPEQRRYLIQIRPGYSAIVDSVLEANLITDVTGDPLHIRQFHFGVAYSVQEVMVVSKGGYVYSLSEYLLKEQCRRNLLVAN